MVFYLEHVLTGDQVFLLEGVNTLGRHSTCSWIMKYDYMSRFHAIILVKRGQIFIKELEALNGVFLNYSEERIGLGLREISVGDDLSFGVKVNGDEELEIPTSFGIFTVKSKEPDSTDPMDEKPILDERTEPDSTDPLGEDPKLDYPTTEMEGQETNDIEEPEKLH
ncbi:uncharacterized protein [Drosophila takahashii]|uniref:uncharacterized protein n=1 Tax=Drosophila takahashii TaxID=29030 RepID=UPI001CF8B7F9|nr:uncharacterized protein LOC108063207 [Drosophila takahashii]